MKLQPRCRWGWVRLAPVALTCALFGGVLPASAVPIEITGGFLSVTGLSGVPVYSLEGPDFLHRGTGGDFGNVRAESCFPCTAGSSINLSSLFTGSSLAGDTTLNGVSYSVPANERGGFLDFDAPSIQVPPSDLSLLLLTDLFSFTGALSLPGGVNVDMTGQGIANLELSSVEQDGFGRLFYFKSIRYDFLEPVPEPGTLLMLGPALLGLGLLRSWRRSA